MQTFELYNVFEVLATGKYLTVLNKEDQKEGHVCEWQALVLENTWAAVCLRGSVKLIRNCIQFFIFFFIFLYLYWVCVSCFRSQEQGEPWALVGENNFVLNSCFHCYVSIEGFLVCGQKNVLLENSFGLNLPGTPLLLRSLCLRETYLESTVSAFVPSDPAFYFTIFSWTRDNIYETVCVHQTHFQRKCHLVEYINQFCLGSVMKWSKSESVPQHKNDDQRVY